MADLTGPFRAGSSRGNDGRTDEGRSRRERGQILLVAALLLAATFVVLALVVNSAIFAENLSTRDDVAGSQDALQYRAEVVDTVGTTMVTLNENSDTTHADLRDRLAAATAALSDQGGIQQSTAGRLATVAYPGDPANTTHGERIAQDAHERNLTSDDWDSDWTLANDVDGARNVQFNFTHVDTDADQCGFFDHSCPSPFTLSIDGPDGTWTMTVRRQFDLFDEDDGYATPQEEVDITTTNPAGESATCTRVVPMTDDSNLTVDVTAGTANGEVCPALNRLQATGAPLWLGAGTDTPYDVEFTNGGPFNGTYSMVVAGTANGFTLESGVSSDEPYHTDAIYAVTLGYGYHASAVAYDTEVRVAPGEAPP